MGVICCKFGGSSFNSHTLPLVKEILGNSQNGLRRFCVISAMGKRFIGDVKTTDLLIHLAEQAREKGGKVFEGPLFASLFDRHQELISKLDIAVDCEKLFCEAFLGYRNTDFDFLVSRGETLSGKIFASYMDWDYLDSFNTVIIGKNGKVNIRQSINNIRRAIKQGKNTVMSGFYGNCLGRVKLLSRGGSDYSGALLAVACGANLYENYIDVDGLKTADPRIVGFPETVKHLGYQGLGTLNMLTQDVLLAESLKPCRQFNLPVRIRSVYNPHSLGTLIDGNAEYGTQGRAIAISSGKVRTEPTKRGEKPFILMDLQDRQIRLFPYDERQKESPLYLTVILSDNVKNNQSKAEKDIDCEELNSDKAKAVSIVTNDRRKEEKDIDCEELNSENTKAVNIVTAVDSLLCLILPDKILLLSQKPLVAQLYERLFCNAIL